MKCFKCGYEFDEGMFCPECGTKFDAEEAKRIEDERITLEKIKKEEERKQKELQRQERKEKRELELEKAKVEQERIAKEKAEKEAEVLRLKNESLRMEQEIAQQKADEERQALERKVEEERATADKISRTYKEVVFDSAELAARAAEEDQTIDMLKKRLMATTKQKERRIIIERFNDEIITEPAKSRLRKLKNKVSIEPPKSNIYCTYYGISVIISIVLATMFDSLLMVNLKPLGIGIACWAGFGMWIWPIWRIVIAVRNRSKESYLYIKDI